MNLDAVRVKHKPRTVAHWFEAGVPFSHVMVQFVHDDRIWTHDAWYTVSVMDRAPVSGWRLEPYTRKPIVDGYLSVGELRAAANDAQGWNEEFDRDNGIPAINRYVRDYLSRQALQWTS